jgi:hypothetical protein
MKKYILLFFVLASFTIQANTIQNAILNADATNTFGNGVVTSAHQELNGGTVIVIEDGNMAVHRTFLRFNSSPVVLTNNAGVALYGGFGTGTTQAVYTFPKGNILIHGAECVGTLTLTTAGALATFASVSALGTVTSASDATLTGTEANILASTSSSAAVTKAAALKNISLIAPGAPLDGTVTAIPMFLNFVVANDASNSTGVGTYIGNCTVTWSNLSTAN